MKKLLLIFIIMLWCLPLFPQATVAPVSNGRLTFTDAAGHPCAGCKLSTFFPGTTTPQGTYTDYTGTVLNENPVTLDSTGSHEVWLLGARYKLVLKTAAGATLWSVDGVPSGDALYLRLDGGNSPVTGAVTFNGNMTATAGQNKLVAYSINRAIVLDGVKYTTLQAAITAACAASPVAPVMLPPGTYAVNTALTLCAGLSILGSGQGNNVCSTNITSTLASGDLFYLNSFSDMRVTDLCITYSGSGANAAIRLTAAQRNNIARLFINGPFARGIQLDSSSTATASTIWNRFDDIHITGLAANGIGCLLDSADAVAKVINGNVFTNVRCTGGTGGVGLKLTNSNQAMVINENVINCSECLATSGTGIQIDQGATSDLVLIAPTVEGSTTGFNKATANTVSIYGGKISSNTTNVTDAQPLFTSFINTLIGGTVQQFSVNPAGGLAIAGISIGGAGLPTANSINGATGWTGNVASVPVFAVNAGSFVLAQPLYSPSNVVFVTTDFTTANNTNLQAITGLSWTMPANTALNLPFTCELLYSQATAAVVDNFGIQDVTVAPTNIAATGIVATSLSAASYGNQPNITTTTATAFVGFTPSATATVFIAHLSGLIEQPSNASSSVVNIMVQTTNGADALTIKRGGWCKF